MDGCSLSVGKSGKVPVGERAAQLGVEHACLGSAFAKDESIPYGEWWVGGEGVGCACCVA